ncbi:MAG: hypothetical protein V1831_01050 [Candidatus Woesearchaeota archaeon]
MQQNLLMRAPPTTKELAEDFFEFIKQLYSSGHGITDSLELDELRGKYTTTNSLVSILEKIDGSNDVAVNSIVDVITKKEKSLQQLSELTNTDFGNAIYSAFGLDFKKKDDIDKGIFLAEDIAVGFSEKEKEKLKEMFSPTEMGIAIYATYKNAIKLSEDCRERQERKALILGRIALERKEYMDSKQDLLVKDVNPLEIRKSLKWMIEHYKFAETFVNDVYANKLAHSKLIGGIMDFAYAKGIVAMNQLYNTLQLIKGKDGSAKRITDQLVFSFGRSLEDVTYTYCRALDLSRGEDKMESPDINDAYDAIRSLPNLILRGMPEERRQVLKSFDMLKRERYMFPRVLSEQNPISAAYITLYAMQKPEVRETFTKFLGLNSP